MQSAWSYIERVETKISPPMLDATVAVAKLEGLTISEFLRRAILAEIEDQYPGIATWLKTVERYPGNRHKLTEEIEDQLSQAEENAAMGIPW